MRPSAAVGEPAGVCFGALTTVERCQRCGRHHPAGVDERCLELASEAAAATLDSELASYLQTPEAVFFDWLARRR